MRYFIKSTTNGLESQRTLFNTNEDALVFNRCLVTSIEYQRKSWLFCVSAYAHIEVATSVFKQFIKN